VLAHWINVLIPATLIMMMLRIGLDVAIVEIADTARNPRLIVLAMLANYVCVPALTVVLLLALNTQPIISIAFLILAVCPGAPFGPPLTSMAKGNVPASVGLMVILAGSSAVLAPLLLRILLRFLSSEESLQVDALKMVKILLVSQLLPLCAGLALRMWRPSLADKVKRPFEIFSSALMLITFVLVLVLYYPVLLGIRLIAFGAMLLLSLASLGVGWISGGRDPGTRKAMALTTSFRNAGVGMVIAAGGFAGTPVLSAIVAYTVVSTVGTVAPALWWGNRASTN
jgi:bile acid:Na+ symporter, BASS family